MQKSEDCLTLTLAEAAAYSGIGRSKLEMLQKSVKRFPSFKVGTKTLVDKALLAEYIHQLARDRMGEVVMNPVIAEILEHRRMSRGK